MTMLKLKKQKKINRLNIIVFLVVVSTLLLLSLLNNVATPIMQEYAEIYTNKIGSMLISKAISKELTHDFNIDNLITVTLNAQGDIQSVDFNTVVVNKVLAATNNLVQLNLNSIEQGELDQLGLSSITINEQGENKSKEGIILEIPMGLIFRNSFLNNLGTKIPIQLKLIGSVNSNIKTRITNYGINAALIEVIVVVGVTEQIILPFSSKKVVVSTEIPIIMKIMQGTVPKFYGNSHEFTTPIYNGLSSDFTQ